MAAFLLVLSVIFLGSFSWMYYFAVQRGMILSVVDIARLARDDGTVPALQVYINLNCAFVFALTLIAVGAGVLAVVPYARGESAESSAPRA